METKPKRRKSKYIYIAVGLAEAMGIFSVLLAFLVLFS